MKKNYFYVGCVFICLAIFLGVLILTGKTVTDVKDEVTKSEEELTIRKAIKKLGKYNKPYYVINDYRTNYKETNYLEVNKPDGTSYKDVPVDVDGNRIDSMKQEISGYMLYDWITSDNVMYDVRQFTNDDGEIIDDAWIMPKSYGEYCKSRRLFYLDKMIDNLKDIKKGTNVTFDLGKGKEEIDVYVATLPKEYVKDIVSVENCVLFDLIKKDYTDNANIIKFCDYYKEVTGINQTFSDATVSIGVSNGIVKYMELVAGGLGQRLIFTKLFNYVDDNTELREEPNFSKTKDYVVETYQESADYIASFETPTDAIKALDNMLYGSNAMEEKSSDKEENKDSSDEGNEIEDSNVIEDNK